MCSFSRNSVGLRRRQEPNFQFKHVFSNRQSRGIIKKPINAIQLGALCNIYFLINKNMQNLDV